MKSMKKLFSIFVVSIMLLAMAVPAFAAAQTANLTINGTVEGKKYDLYRVFDLTQADTNYSYTVSPAFEAFFTAKAASNTGWNNPVEKIESMSDNSEALSTLAQELPAYAVANDVTPVMVTGSSGGTSTVVNNLDYGYYLLNPLGGSTATGSYATMFALNTLSGNDSTITVKAEYPTVVKKIVEDGADVSTSNAAVGDTITFKVTSKVPDMTGYTKYFFVVNDTLSAGLDYASITSIKIGDMTLSTSDYALTTIDNADNTTSLKIVFNNFIQYQSNQGQAIEIIYTAVLNEDALIGTANPNEVTITYSNDPKVTPTGENEPDPNDPVGTTPKAETETFATELTINKVDAEGNKLTGAAFRITGDSLHKVITKGDVFTVDTDGTYWKLKDGSYTTQAPNGNEELYASTTVKYTRSTQTTVDTTITDVNAEGFVDGDGKLVFSGLGEGTYTISEIVTPSGYNTIDPFTVTITFDAATETFSAARGDTNLSVENNKISLNVVNLSGNVLPSTGGVGTTLFYIVGALFVCVAGVALVVRKRMSAERSK